MTVSVRVPATSANLGPGFDSLGLALGLYDEVTAVRSKGATRVTVTGEGAGELPSDDQHLLIQAVRAAFAELDRQPPALAVTCHNRIPQARGLGSSSATIVAGLMLARELLRQEQDPAAERLSEDVLLDLADRLEGHPDNVAPCLLGGFTIAWREGGRARAVRLDPSPVLQPVVFVPQQRGLTAAARALLPEQVPHADAAHAAGRAALLVAAMTSSPWLLLAATEDRLHQPYRAAAAPKTAELVARLRAAGVAAMVSGAGPSVLALATAEGQLPGDQPGWVRHTLPVDSAGACAWPGNMGTYPGGNHRTRRDGPVLPQVGPVV
jgi:homoserine kinase